MRYLFSFARRETSIPGSGIARPDSLFELDEVGTVNGEMLVQDFAEFLGQNNRDGASVARVDRDREGAGVAIVAVNGAVGLPDTIGVPGGVAVVANEENSCPEVRFQTVLGFDRSEIITGGNDATVENDEIIFARGEEDRLLRASRRPR